MSAEPAASTEPVRPGESSGRSPLRRLGRFARKELRESLRDRRTLVTLVLMPLLVYPLLGTVVQRFAFSGLTRERPVALVMADLSTPPEELRLLMEATGREFESRLSPRQNETPPRAPSIADPDGSLMDSLPGDLAATARGEVRLEFLEYGAEGDVLDEAVRTGDADVALRRYPPGTDDETGRRRLPVVEVISRAGDAFSARAAEELERRIIACRDQSVRMALQRVGLRGDLFPAVTRHAVASDESGRTMLLGAFIPLVLVLMTMTGAVYPAIDLTAGERERGTLEMLMASPASRRDILTGKFVAVCTIAMMTAVVNLTAMLVTIYSIGFDRIVFGSGVDGLVLLQVLLLLIVFASFFSAILLSVTSVARSFREAQAYIIPLMLLSLAPGILSLMPNVRFTLPLAFVPLVNIVLLGRDLFQGQAAGLPFAVTLLATMCYTIVSLRIAGRLFGNDAALYGNGGGIADLWNRPPQPLAAASLPVAVGCFAVLLPLYLVLSGLRGRILNIDNITLQMAWSGGVTLLLFAVLPAGTAAWQRVRIRTGFALRRPTSLQIAGALLLGASLWPFAYEALLWFRSQVLEDLLGDKADELAARIAATPLAVRLISLALLPAACEEFFFRGFLQTSLLEHGARRHQAVLITAALFGALHVVVDQALMLERFIPSFLLGVVLAVIRIRTGSLFPGIVLHLTHNALLLSLSDLTPLLERLQLDVEGQSHLPAAFLIGAGVIAAAGGVLLAVAPTPAGRSETPRPDPSGIGVRSAAENGVERDLSRDPSEDIRDGDSARS